MRLPLLLLILAAMPAFAAPKSDPLGLSSLPKAVDIPSVPAVSDPVENEDHQIAAVVNEDIITRLELEERMRLAIATTGLPDTAETRAQLLPRILQNLVDESLQMQEAKKNSINVESGEIDQAIGSLERERGRPPGSLIGFLGSRGIPERTFREQLETQIAWSKLVGQKIRKNVRVNEEEVDSEVERRMSPKAKKQEVLLASLVLPVENPEAESATRELAVKLLGAIKQGASFEALTTQLSSGQASAIGATWVDMGQLEPKVAEEVDETTPPGIIGPVRTPSGYQILQVKDKRETSLERSDAEVNFKRILLSLQEDAEVREVDVLMQIAKEVAKAPGSCKQEGIAGIENFEGLNIKVDFLRTHTAQLSDQLEPLVENLKVGQVSEPFATPEGIQLLMLCERADLPLPVPDKEKIRRQIYRQKLDLEAQKYMRNLRRTAYLDVRVRPKSRKPVS